MAGDNERFNMLNPRFAKIGKLLASSDSSDSEAVSCFLDEIRLACKAMTAQIQKAEMLPKFHEALKTGDSDLMREVIKACYGVGAFGWTHVVLFACAT